MKLPNILGIINSNNLIMSGRDCSTEQFASLKKGEKMDFLELVGILKCNIVASHWEGMDANFSPYFIPIACS